MSESHRRVFAESLERRSLLSSSTPSIPQSASAVEVIELTVGDDDEDIDGTIQPDALPDSIRAAVANAFPHAVLIDAESDDEDGELSYSVSALLDGERIELTLSSAGELLEREVSIDTTQLPRSVLDWIARTYPGAVIDEAAVLPESGVPTYDLSFETADGRSFVATLRLTVAPVSHAAGTTDIDESIVHPPPDEHSRHAAENVAKATSTGDSSEFQPEPLADAAVTPARVVAVAAPASEPAPRQTLAAEATAAAIDAEFAAVLLAAQAGLIAVEAARELSEILPIDLAAIELRLADLLSQLDAASSRLLVDAARSGNAIRISLVAALVGCAKLALLKARGRRVARTAFSFDAGTSTWGWLPDLSPSRRSRWSLQSNLEDHP